MHIYVGVAKKLCPQIKSAMGTRRVAKRVHMGIINGHLTTRYLMDMNTDLMILVPAVSVPVNKLSKLLKCPCVYVK